MVEGPICLLRQTILIDPSHLQKLWALVAPNPPVNDLSMTMKLYRVPQYPDHQHLFWYRKPHRKCVLQHGRGQIPYGTDLWSSQQTQSPEPLLTKLPQHGHGRLPSQQTKRTPRTAQLVQKVKLGEWYTNRIPIPSQASTLRYTS